MESKEIRKRLIDLGLTQTQLAQQLNIPRNRVSDALANRKEGRKYQKPISDFLGIPMCEGSK